MPSYLLRPHDFRPRPQGPGRARLPRDRRRWSWSHSSCCAAGVRRPWRRLPLRRARLALERVDDLAARVPPGRHVVLRVASRGPCSGDRLRADGVRLAADALGRIPERRLDRRSEPERSETDSSGGCARRRCGSSGARSSSRSTCRGASCSCATHAASSGGSASRSAHPPLRLRSAASTSPTSCAARTSARTTAAASSRSRAGSRTFRRAGRAAIGWRSTAPPRRPGATPSRTAACTRRSPTFAT